MRGLSGIGSDGCDPLKLTLVKTELEGRVDRRLFSRVLTGIVIPSRKTQARHSGQLCSIRGKSGGARSEAKPYRRVEQTTGQSTSRLELRVAVGFALFFSSP